MRTPQEWVGYPEAPEAPGLLPRDLTPDTDDFGRPCMAAHLDGYMCTRNREHTGRHAAGNGDVIVAVWS